MTSAALLLIFAVLAQGVLALALVWLLGTIRVPLVTRGEIPIKEIALSREAWPQRGKQVSNAFDNQFQLPVLFFVAALISLYLQPTWFDALLAWAFVASRFVHAAIFVTTNHVVRRFAAYAVGYGILCAMWLLLIMRVLLAFVSRA